MVLGVCGERSGVDGDELKRKLTELRILEDTASLGRIIWLLGLVHGPKEDGCTTGRTTPPFPSPLTVIWIDPVSSIWRTALFDSPTRSFSLFFGTSAVSYCFCLICQFSGLLKRRDERMLVDQHIRHRWYLVVASYISYTNLTE